MSLFCIILSITGLQSDVVFGEPSLCSAQLSQPPVLPLLQHADHIALGEAQQCGDDVTAAAAAAATAANGEVQLGVGGRRPRGDRPRPESSPVLRRRRKERGGGGGGG